VIQNKWLPVVQDCWARFVKKHGADFQQRFESRMQVLVFRTPSDMEIENYLCEAMKTFKCLGVVSGIVVNKKGKPIKTFKKFNGSQRPSPTLKSVPLLDIYGIVSTHDLTWRDDFVPTSNVVPDSSSESIDAPRPSSEVLDLGHIQKVTPYSISSTMPPVPSQTTAAMVLDNDGSCAGGSSGGKSRSGSRQKQRKKEFNKRFESDEFNIRAPTSTQAMKIMSSVEGQSEWVKQSTLKSSAPNNATVVDGDKVLAHMVHGIINPKMLVRVEAATVKFVMAIVARMGFALNAAETERWETRHQLPSHVLERFMFADHRSTQSIGDTDKTAHPSVILGLLFEQGKDSVVHVAAHSCFQEEYKVWQRAVQPAFDAMYSWFTQMYPRDTYLADLKERVPGISDVLVCGYCPQIFLNLCGYDNTGQTDLGHFDELDAKNQKSLVLSLFGSAITSLRGYRKTIGGKVIELPVDIDLYMPQGSVSATLTRDVRHCVQETSIGRSAMVCTFPHQFSLACNDAALKALVAAASNGQLQRYFTKQQLQWTTLEASSGKRSKAEPRAPLVDGTRPPKLDKAKHKAKHKAKRAKVDPGPASVLLPMGGPPTPPPGTELHKSVLPPVLAPYYKDKPIGDGNRPTITGHYFACFDDTSKKWVPSKLRTQTTSIFEVTYPHTDGAHSIYATPAWIKDVKKSASALMIPGHGLPEGQAWKRFGRGKHGTWWASLMR
jgi:hypothetical protein